MAGAVVTNLGASRTAALLLEQEVLPPGEIERLAELECKVRTPGIAGECICVHRQCPNWVAAVLPHRRAPPQRRTHHLN